MWSDFAVQNCSITALARPGRPYVFPNRLDRAPLLLVRYANATHRIVPLVVRRPGRLRVPNTEEACERNPSRSRADREACAQRSATGARPARPASRF